jgi:NAD+-dependent protein deacetylase sirtuin 4
MKLGIASPDDDPHLGSDFEALVAGLAGRRLVVLTGAGCSTESGIPDYRGNGQPPSRKPIQHDAFVRAPEVRQRYWARATLGWERFSAARPNAAHTALAEMEAAGCLGGIITQNVDRLHHAAGSRRVIELHGALADVLCLDCGAHEDRAELHRRLLAANAAWPPFGARAAVAAPDGDTELPASAVAGFEVLGCSTCAVGTLMPDVVFFGGTVASAKVEAAWSMLTEADVLLVVGSSLAVYSGWRFVRGASERGIPIALVNLGRTRADDITRFRIDGRAGVVLPRLAARLGSAQGPPGAQPV